MEKLKRGQKSIDWKENCEKFYEYYRKRNPDWTIEQCKEAAKKFNKSINWQCIEFYQKKYPGKTLEEYEEMRKQAIAKKNENHSFSIEYYRKRFPNSSEEELKQMLSDHVKENNFQNIEYYRKRFPNSSEEELKQMLSDAKKKYLEKRPDNSGENNPAHHSKTSSLERRQRSPKCIEFYQLKYPGLTMEEYENMVREHKKLTASRLTPEKHSTKIEYWLAKGYNEKDARKKLSERQRTFTLEQCIEKYGEEGINVFNNRQNKWQKSLHKTFEEHRMNGISQSKFANSIINLLIDKLVTDCDREFVLENYSFDFKYKDKLIEFNGDYWHCNPEIYDENFINPTTNKTAKQIWDKDNLKRKTAEKYGYKVYVVWEKDYQEDMPLVIKKCMDFLTL